MHFPCISAFHRLQPWRCVPAPITCVLRRDARHVFALTFLRQTRYSTACPKYIYLPFHDYQRQQSQNFLYPYNTEESNVGVILQPSIDVPNTAPLALEKHTDAGFMIPLERIHKLLLFRQIRSCRSKLVVLSISLGMTDGQLVILQW